MITMTQTEQKLKIAICIAPAWSLETPPLSLGLLSAVAREEGVEHKQFDLNLQSALLALKESDDEEIYEKYWAPGSTIKWTNEEIFKSETFPKFEELLDAAIEEMASYDVITFTVFYSNMLCTDVLAQKLKSLKPSIKILYGGPFCWNNTKGGLHDIDIKRPWVDLGCPMEGEEVLRDTLKALQNQTPLSEVAGAYTWNEKQEAHFNGPRPAIRDLGSLPAANWDGVDLDTYAPFQHKGETHLPIQGSRGCTFKCTFCAETRVYRFKKGPDLKTEIVELYNKYGIRNFTFVDSLINGSLIHFKRLVYGLNEEIQAGRLPRLRISGYSRVHSDMDDEFMKIAGEVGYNLLSIGIESGSPKILELIEKGQTVEMAESFLRSCHRGGVWAIANWITGYPKETHMDWLVSLHFLYRNRKYLPDIAANYRPAGVTPGTALDVYRDKFDLVKHGHILHDFISHNLHSTYINRNLRHKLTHLYLDIFKFFYSGSIGVSEHIEELFFKDRQHFDYNSDMFKSWVSKDIGSFWTQGENELRYPDLFKNRELQLDVPYLEYANIPEPETWDGNRPAAEIIKEQTRNEIRTWVWFIHQIAGPFKIKFKMEDTLPERNFPGVYFLSEFTFESHFSGDYQLKIHNQLQLDDSLQNSEAVWLPSPDNPEGHCYQDIQFEDHFEDSGNFNQRYSGEEHIKNRIEGIPNYIDTFDAEKYRINLRRTEMTGKF